LASLYYAVIMKPDLIDHSSISYIFSDIVNVGLRDISSVSRPQDQPLIQAIAKAINGYIETRKLHA
jgi:dTDP-glucose pyrophosphorylase